MKNYFHLRVFPLALMVPLLLASIAGAQTEHHRATRLGNPATRFAPTMYVPADLRARFADQKLRPDFVEVLRQWGWTGNLGDFFAAGLTNEIVEWQIPVGDTMPFMSSREAGRPTCLRNVTWAGDAPISAYAFTFISNGRVYRCITPKPCSNFFVEDLGPAPRVGLALACNVPERVIAGRPVDACLNIQNTGNVSAPRIVVTLPVPEDAAVAAVTDGGVVTNQSVVWNLLDLSAAATKQVCVRLKSGPPGTLRFDATADSADAPAAQSACQTTVVGIPAILLEKADDPDPVAIGTNTTYTVKVTNQGTAPDANVHVVVTVDDELVPVSASEGTITGQSVDFPVVPTLAPKAAVTYTVLARGVKAGMAVTKFTLSSEMLKSSISAEESTTVY